MLRALSIKALTEFAEVHADVDRARMVKVLAALDPLQLEIDARAYVTISGGTAVAPRLCRLWTGFTATQGGKTPHERRGFGYRDGRGGKSAQAIAEELNGARLKRPCRSSIFGAADVEGFLRFIGIPVLRSKLPRRFHRPHGVRVGRRLRKTMRRCRPSYRSGAEGRNGTPAEPSRTPKKLKLARALPAGNDEVRRDRRKARPALSARESMLRPSRRVQRAARRNHGIRRCGGPQSHEVSRGFCPRCLPATKRPANAGGWAMQQESESPWIWNGRRKTD